MMHRSDLYLDQMDKFLDNKNFSEFFKIIINNPTTFSANTIGHAKSIKDELAKSHIDPNKIEGHLYSLFKELKEDASNKEENDLFNRFENMELRVTYSLFFRYEAQTRLTEALAIKDELKEKMIASLQEKPGWIDKADLSKSPGLKWILEEECDNNREILKQKIIENLNDTHIVAEDIIHKLIDRFNKSPILTNNDLVELSSKTNFPYSQYIKYNMDNKPGGELSYENAATLEFIKLYCTATHGLTFNKDDKHPEYARHRIFLGLEPFQNLDGLKINLNRILHRDNTVQLKIIPCRVFEEDGKVAQWDTCNRYHSGEALIIVTDPIIIWKVPFMAALLQKHYLPLHNNVLMKRPIIFVIFIFFSISLPAQENSFDTSINPATMIWLSKPAAKWEEALPVGNGRLGAMIYGGVNEAVFQLNEETYWSGGPYSTVHKGGHEKLKEIQQLVFDQKMLEAHNLFGRHLMGYPVEQQKYQSLGNLNLQFDHGKDFSNYRRWLDLETGVSGVEYTVDGKKFRQEILSSQPHQSIAIRITSSVPGSITFTANLRGVRNQAHSNYGTDYFQMNGGEPGVLTLTGKSADYLGVEGKLRYEASARVVPEGGTMKQDGYILKVSNADAVTIYIVAATDFKNYKDVSGNPHERVKHYMSLTAQKDFSAVREAHIKDHQQLFSRVSLNLPNTANSFLPTDERMTQIQTSPDPSLAALCYQFGRYLLIGSSRPGTQPANLQGIWNNDMNPAWDSKYTVNINTEMNYWAAESSNLAECVEPLLKMMKEIVDQGTQVAREHYGARGWVLHQNTDIWRVAAPMDGPSWGTFTVGGAWLVNGLWEHYRYTQDQNFLNELYPLMKGSVEFFMDFLIPHPNGKWLVTNPSTSPENFPGSPGNGRYFDEVTGSMIPGTTICAGSTIDMQILHDLFGYYMQASKLLNVDDELAKKVAAARLKLVPPQIGKDGALQEWADDWEQLEKNHRHYSHLYGLYPGNVLSPIKTPDFMNACKAVLEQRGDGGTGWSRAWKVGLWARLKDGDRANKIFKGYLKEQAYPQLFAKCFTPLQVDGSMGMTAGISELLVQSNEGYIELLPALPSEWKDGSFNGVCTREGFELSFSWKDGIITKLSILSKQGRPCRLRTSLPLKSMDKKLKISTKEPGIIEFATTQGQKYEFIPAKVSKL